MSISTCQCGCGRRYEVFLGRSVGTVRLETTTVEQYRPGLYRKDIHWVNSHDKEWSPTRGEAIDILLRAAHAGQTPGGQP